MGGGQERGGSRRIVQHAGADADELAEYFDDVAPSMLQSMEKNATAFAMSSGSPARPTGIRAMI